jgi:outer membrane protein assembly factor BamB
MKNIIILIAIACFIISCNSCKKQFDEPATIVDKDGVVLKQPFLWRTPLTNEPYIGTFIYPSLVWKDKMIFGAETNNSSELALLDINNGNKIWQKPYASKENAAMSSAYQYNNIAVIEAENAVARGINIETGEFLWVFDKPGRFMSWGISGIDNIFFHCGQTQTVNKPYAIWAAWVGNVETGETEEFFVPDITGIADTSSIVQKVGAAGGVESIIPYKAENGDILLVINHSTFFKSQAGEYYFSLYNFTKKEFVYSDIRLSASGTSQVSNGKIYFALFKEICCYDLMSGEKLWGKTYPSGFSGQGFLVEDGQLITMEHYYADSYLICLDAQTGNTNRQILSKQLGAPIRYLNGIIYFVSSEDHKLHAYDASTGKELWRITSPDYDAGDHGAFFKPECTLVPGKDGAKGKVIVSSYLSAFCYEAIK